ncbi:MAG: nuclear transport factor 2 family protein [Lutibacter sp.]|nr:nuclear transport factor 2 family protein [Lutibacter sp.]
MQTKKAMAQHFLKLAAKGNSREAFKLYAGKDFKHHNVYFKGDADTLIKAIEEDAKINPDKIFEIQRALEDGDLVAIHSRFRQNPNDTDWAVMHIFRFENDKVAELWDFAQAAPDEMINENGMF